MSGARMVGLAGLVLVGGVLAGCSASTPEAASNSAGDAVPAPAAPAVGKVDSGAGSAPQEQAQPQQPQQQQQQQVSQPGVDRKLIRTANLELVTKDDVAELAGKARDVATARGGFSGKEDVRGDQASITLQVPSDQFDRAIGELSGLVPKENVKSRSMTSEDVTEQVVDVESRIATQRQSVERVRGLLARAQTVAEIVQIEGEVTRREADLESLEKRRERLSGQVALSTVTVRIARDGSPPAPAQDDGGFLGALRGGWNAFLAAGGLVLRVLGATLPFLVVLGVPAALAYWWRRRRVRAAAAAPLMPHEAQA